MKKLIFSLTLILASAMIAFSQGNGNGNGNGNNANWPPAVGESSTACGANNALIPQAPGGVVNPPATEGWPMNKVVEILRLARPYYPNMNLGQMIQVYRDCSCVITYLGNHQFLVRLSQATDCCIVVTLESGF